MKIDEEKTQMEKNKNEKDKKNETDLKQKQDLKAKKQRQIAECEKKYLFNLINYKYFYLLIFF